jgi:cellulose synthase (UDP-forming)
VTTRDTAPGHGGIGPSAAPTDITPAGDSASASTVTRVVAARDRRRQWGSERARPALPAVSPVPRPSATWIGGFAIAFTICAWLTYLGRTVVSGFIDDGVHDSGFLAQTVLYVAIMTLLTFSACMYLIARQGALYATRDHVRVPRAEIDAHMANRRPSMTVLVPSYREDADVVRATLLSAALQEYPGIKVVLLVDDPPDPSEADAIEGLAACRALPSELESLLRVPRERVINSLIELEAAALHGGPAESSEVRSLAADFVWSAAWLDDLAAGWPRHSHSDDFLADEVLRGLARDFEVTAEALHGALDAGAAVPSERLGQLCRRLVWTFEADIASFERKQYANLPHDANKAMNLNAYIGLMGRRFEEVETRIGLVLRESRAVDALDFADSDYLLTLDADSVLLREYCLRLTYHLELPGNERIAVIQTPYSAFRGAETRLERIAGATTDIQHIVHQGLTHFGATFWVGANAVIRKPALDDIVEISYVGGQEVRRYVQDRTVIEDTESSVDLVANGWSLFNYPERLSYSATPPDFGSLVVQRARWANGGLLIAPKFLRYVRRAREAGQPVPKVSVALRLNYMASICWASVGLVLLLMLPFNSRLLSPVALLAAAPYFIAMSADFHRLGYKRTDVFRVYAFNLILLPVNLAGTLKSLQQAAARSKIAFARTPKVRDRTAAPALFVLAAYLIAAFSFWTLQQDIVSSNWSNAAFASLNGTLTLYAIVAFMGLGNSLVDIVVGAMAWVRVPVTATEPVTTDTGTGIDWESVLYFGPDAAADATTTLRTVDATPMPRRGDTRGRHRSSPDTVGEAMQHDPTFTTPTEVNAR